MKSIVLPLVALASLLTASAGLACESRVIIEDKDDRIEVDLDAGYGFIRIRASEEGRQEDDPQWSAGLYSTFRTDAEQFARPVFWLSAQPGQPVEPASLSIGAPDVSGDGHPVAENRIRFGDRTVIRDRQIGWEHFGGHRTSRSEPWTWSRQLGENPLAAFRETGSVRIEFWSGPSRRRLERRTWARYDWSRMERMVGLARERLAACRPSPDAG